MKLQSRNIIGLLGRFFSSAHHSYFANHLVLFAKDREDYKYLFAIDCMGCLMTIRAVSKSED